jgi:hypothetical protein
MALKLQSNTDRCKRSSLVFYRNTCCRQQGGGRVPRGMRDGRIFPYQGGDYRPINKQHQLRCQSAGVARAGFG